ncbi:hypothetical protein [uncultured Shimia sp.]|uniref:hypothetical protein n=1 Tax=uncultured Shimia sp. TaxID=573152 RepID=UPI002631F9DE|nr:hypothetical protein [uncultured Shimia sp.]
MNALTWNMWNTILIQLAFWTALFLLFHLARQDARLQCVSLVLLIVMFASQLCYLLLGHHFVRTHELTEYRETLLALGLMIYAVQTWMGLRKAPVQ